jgi:precorrin-3B methylase
MAQVTLTQQQKQTLGEVLDTALKIYGMKLYGKTISLLNTLDNPVSSDENTNTYEITEQHAQILEEIFDVAIKQVGLTGFYGIADLIATMQASFQAEREVQEQEVAVEEVQPAQ